MLPLLAKQIKTEATGYCSARGCTCECVLVLTVARRYCATSQQLFLCGGRVLVRHKLGEFVGRTWIWAINTLTHPKESLLLSFLQVQLLFKGPLSGFQQIPPLLQQVVVLFIQMFEPLSLILNQQVTFFIL